MDETYIRVKGRWCYLYRALDSAGATTDFLLSALRDADAAKRLFRKPLGNRSHFQLRVINADLASIYSSAIPDSKKEGTLCNRFQAARRTIQGYEAINMIRKRQVRWVAGDDLPRHIRFIDSLFELAA